MTVWPVYRRTTSRDSSKSGSYVYLWADAVYFNVRLQKDRPCVLVVVGATEDGHKELLAIQDGERESHLSWLHLLQDLKARGLKEHSFLAVADGASGFWKALEEALPGARAQQCWVHKTANVLDKLSQRPVVAGRGVRGSDHGPIRQVVSDEKPRPGPHCRDQGPAR